MRESPGGPTRRLGSLGCSGYYVGYHGSSGRFLRYVGYFLPMSLPLVRVRRSFCEPFAKRVLHILVVSVTGGRRCRNPLIIHMYSVNMILSKYEDRR